MTLESTRECTASSFTNSSENTINAMSQLHLVAGLRNASEFDTTTLNLPFCKRKINGDATDQALLQFSESLGLVIELRCFWKTNFGLAFNSKNKFMIRTLSMAKKEGLNLALPLMEAKITCF
jgi:sodium/potassium-transporting ATPase subunit alpha